MEFQNAAIYDEEDGVASGDETRIVSSSESGGCQMTMTSLHRFDETDEAGDSFTIQIIEYNPSRVRLATEIALRRHKRFGGTSLPGLVAAKVGSRVTLTDDLDRPEVLDNIGRVCELNSLKCEVLGLTWGVWDEHIFGLHPEIILGADVLYDTCAFEDLFSTVAFLLESCPGSVFITTYHNRSGHHLIEYLMVKWGLKVVKLVDGFSFLPSHKASGLSGNIQLAEIVLNNHHEKSSSRSRS